MALLNGIFIFLIIKIDFEIIDLGDFDPSYLNITNYDKNWNIYA